MPTLVVVELDPSDDRGTVLLECLQVMFDTHCTELGCTVVANNDVNYDSTEVAELIATAAQDAQSELLRNPDYDTCVYLAPRAMMIPLGPNEPRQEISMTVIIVRTRQRVFEAMMQTMGASGCITPSAERLINLQVDRGQNMIAGGISGDCPELVAQVMLGISEGYELAVERLAGLRN